MTERRSHEPGIEALIEEIDPLAKPLEETWSDETRARHPLPWGWFVLVGLLCAGAVGWSIYNTKSNEEKATLVRDESLAILEKDQEENAAAEVRVNRIISAVKAYLAADNVDKLVPLIRQPERVRPLMESWYSRHPLVPGRFVQLETFQPLTLAARASFWRIACKVDTGTTRQFLVEEMPDGKVAIDWETDVAYQPMDWDTYAKERPQGSFEFRARVEPGFLYSHEFSDSNHWLSFRLTTVRAEETLYGYVDRQSETAREIQLLIEKNANAPVALVLKLSTPPDLKSPRGVVIEKVLSPHWLYLEPPGT
ncbi:hypothetical protein [Luteolibacter sp. LG18]|uniref:hypothetical protein n=1 Tax=Luteolibacter sp. LG18 TaxID=2819286 RepID=UPI002B30CE06|nr:hypothetical protein llg_34320 [Luteolibacter sp. LG18]